ncbi:MAG: DUF1320 domain-containing protein [Firmicutes bacterium]|nr:DUF1320 domain-containing protein [Bacillota bacterium]
MAYCTLEDLLGQAPAETLVRLTDDEETGAINQARVDEAIQNAGAEIDAYAQARLPVPFNPVPTMIRKLAIDIALYNLFARRGIEKDSNDEIVAARYQRAVAFLENLAKGLVTIGQPSPPPQQTVRIDNPERKFIRSQLEGF